MVGRGGAMVEGLVMIWELHLRLTGEHDVATSHVWCVGGGNGARRGVGGSRYRRFVAS